MNEIKEIVSKIKKGTISWLDLKNLTQNQHKEFLRYAYNLKKRFFGNKLKIYIPNQQFPAISITGSECALNCEHCNKKYLESMRDITNPNDLKNFLNNLYENNGIGALISGGCDPDGAVPLDGYLDVIKEIKQHTNLIINTHTGLINKSTAEMLALSKIDIVSFDVNVDEDIIRDIYHLKKEVKDYKIAIELLKNHNLNIVPHICIGLYYGRVKKELETINFIKEIFNEPNLIVIIALIPPKTSIHQFEMPSPESISKLIAVTRIQFPKTEISLGCMRPRGNMKVKLEKYAMKAGINRIEIPSRKSLNWIMEYDPKINFQFFSACCAIPPKYEELARSKVSDLKVYQNYI
jgi:lipoyl synthase